MSKMDEVIAWRKAVIKRHTLMGCNEWGKAHWKEPTNSDIVRDTLDRHRGKRFVCQVSDDDQNDADTDNEYLVVMDCYSKNSGRFMDCTGESWEFAMLAPFTTRGGGAAL